MSHKSGTVIISSIAPEGSANTVQETSVELHFPEGTPIDERVRVFRRTLNLLDRMDHPEGAHGDAD